MANRAGHLTDEQLEQLDRSDGAGDARVLEHVQSCDACRRRRDEMLALRELLARSGRREGRPQHDIVPSAMMRLRLRRYGVANANELFTGFAALVRGLASLFSLPAVEQPPATRLDGGHEKRHE